MVQTISFYKFDSVSSLPQVADLINKIHDDTGGLDFQVFVSGIRNCLGVPRTLSS